MSKIRVGRVGEQIKKEISSLIQSQIKDPRLGFVTVTGVDLTGDLSQATVYVSILGKEEQIKDSMLTLERSKGFLRSEVGKRVRLRQTPELIFKLDESITYGSKIEKLLKDIKNDDVHE